MNEIILIVRANPSNVCGTYEMSMLQNKIGGILPVTNYKEDGIEEYCFTCSEYVVLTEYLSECKLDKELFTAIFFNIIDIMQHVNTYLLHEDNFILQMDYIFIKRESYEIGLVYLPGFKGNVQEQLLHLMECFMKCMDYNDYGAVQLIYHCYSCLSESSCTFDRIQGILKEGAIYKSNNFIERMQNGTSTAKSILAEKRKDSCDISYTAAPVMDEQVEDQEEVGYYPWWCYVKFIGETILLAFVAFLVCWKSGVVFDTIQSSKIKVLGISVIVLAGGWWLFQKNFSKSDRRTKLKVVQKFVSYKDSGDKMVGLTPKAYNQDTYVRKQIQEISYDRSRLAQIEEPETVLLSYEENETQVLASQEKELRLYTKDNKEIIINRDQIIGSGVHADIILNNRMISREHAKIIKDKEEYSIMDLQSTNGTFVNNCSLLTGEKLPLHQGDIIKIANEELKVG